ncbi:MAG: hypothetical protein IH586_15320 [Anaerolineaceae bacterium]|nr:hypothetical protein [Anaerolineaceae bacterium]
MTNLTLAIRALPARAGALRSSWFWKDILAPFLLTRLAWVLAAFYAVGNYQPNPTYLEFARRGYQFSKYFLIDIWAHWDARFYLSIIKDGYQMQGQLGDKFTNLAFFPLYPYLVKALTWLAWGWTGEKVNDSLTLLVGIILSNLLFLAGMAFLYRLATRHLALNPIAVKRALGLIFAFPVAFIFSCFYTESLYFFLTLAAFSAALERRWMWAGLCAGLVSLARVQGILAAFALLIIYLQNREWKLSAIRADVLWLGLSPLLLGAHLFNLYRLTGSFLAPFAAQAAWGRGQYNFFDGLRIQLEAPVLDVYKIDAVLVLLFIACGIYILWKWPVKAFGIYTLLMVIIPISTGMLISASRFLLVVFPVFLLLGEKLKEKEGYEFARILGFALQVVYFAGWVNYYWIV